jgi:S1-C subfamily serine protease
MTPTTRINQRARSKAVALSLSLVVAGAGAAAGAIVNQPAKTTTVIKRGSSNIAVSNTDGLTLGAAFADVSNGAQVASVSSGSPADDAGLEAGDVVTAIDGKAVSSADELAAAINAKVPGDKLALAVRRGAERSTVEVTLGTRPTSS